jgi:26S proteasome regulatory subunit N4
MQTLNETDGVKNQLLELDKKREGMEKEMIMIVDLLENMNGNPGVKGSMIDEEGFPRADVDIFEVRKLRNRHACL